MSVITIPMSWIFNNKQELNIKQNIECFYVYNVMQAANNVHNVTKHGTLF